MESRSSPHVVYSAVNIFRLPHFMPDPAVENEHRGSKARIWSDSPSVPS